MKRLLILLLLLGGQASAGYTDLWRLLGNGKSVFFLSGGDAVYQVKSNNATISVGVNVSDFAENGYSMLSLTAFKFNGKLDKNELILFSQDITKLATKCFNLDSSRIASIQSWLVTNSVKEAGAFQTAQGDSAQANFGPLKLALFKRGDGLNGQAVTVDMARTGIPGESPWVNHCVVSG